MCGSVCMNTHVKSEKFLILAEWYEFASSLLAFMWLLNSVLWCSVFLTELMYNCLCSIRFVSESSPRRGKQQIIGHWTRPCIYILWAYYETMGHWVQTHYRFPSHLLHSPETRRLKAALSVGILRLFQWHFTRVICSVYFTLEMKRGCTIECTTQNITEKERKTWELSDVIFLKLLFLFEVIYWLDYI